MPAPRRTRTRCDLSFDPENIFALRNRAIGVNAAKNRPAAADLAVIDNYESPELWNAIMIVDHQRPARLNSEPAHFVSFQLLALACRAGGRRGDRRRVGLCFETRRVH